MWRLLICRDGAVLQNRVLRVDPCERHFRDPFVCSARFLLLLTSSTPRTTLAFGAEPRKRFFVVDIFFGEVERRRDAEDIARQALIVVFVLIAQFALVRGRQCGFGQGQLLYASRLGIN